MNLLKIIKLNRKITILDLFGIYIMAYELNKLRMKKIKRDAKIDAAL